MVDAVRRAGRRRANEPMGLAASRYAAMGWPICPGVEPRDRQARERPPRERPTGQRVPQQGSSGRACSCDRVGCPAPGAHPLSPAWKLEATAEAAVVRGWWGLRPQAGILLVTGRVFDVLDVPGRAGLIALERLAESGTAAGPLAIGRPHPA